MDCSVALVQVHEIGAFGRSYSVYRTTSFIALISVNQADDSEGFPDSVRVTGVTGSPTAIPCGALGLPIRFREYSFHTPNALSISLLSAACLATLVGCVRKRANLFSMLTV